MFLSNLFLTSLLSASILFSGGVSEPVTISPSVESVTSDTAVACFVEIEPYRDVQEWQYKISSVDGKVYQRLWSRTRGIWLTDWIPLV